MSLIRPYLAIIVDSFHSALASRVLWAAMLAIWLLLGSLAPIGLREDYTTQFRWFDVYNGTRMKALLAQGMVDPESKDLAIGRIAAAMPDEMQRKLQRVGEGDEVRIRLNLLTDALNELIQSDATRGSLESGEPSDGWYEAEAWKSTVRLRELRELDETADDALETSLRERRARLRIEAALPGVFEARSARSVLLTYAGLDFPTDFQIDRAQFETIFNQFVIPVLVNWLLGLVLVFLGVLVTASIVPDMLQTGSLHLLLSKPISRWALIVSKFIGGCAFVLLCVTQLVIGLYLIAALRLEVWNARILWCLPVALLIFAVFYSVSVLAALKWRSAIISIAAAGALAAVCVVVGIIGGVIDARVVQPDRIASMTTAGGDLFAVTGGSGLVRLDEGKDKRGKDKAQSEPARWGQGRWESIIDSEAMSNDRILPPVALDDDRLMTARIRNGRFNPFGSGSLDLIVLSRDDGWKPQPNLRLPTATERLIMIDGDRIAAVNTADILVTSRSQVIQSLEPAEENPAGEAKGKPSAESTQTNSKPNSTNGPTRQPAAKSVGSWLRTLMTMQGGATEDFTSILPREVSLSPPARLAAIPGENALILLSADRLFRLAITGDTDPTASMGPSSTGPSSTGPSSAGPSVGTSSSGTVVAKADLFKGEETAGPVLASSSRFVLIARGDQPLKILDAVTLVEQGQWENDSRQARIEGTPIEIVSIGDDRFVYRTTSGHADVIEVIEAGADKNATATSSAISSATTDSDVPKPAIASWTIRHVQRVDCDEIESMNWSPNASGATDGTLNIAHDVDRISRFSISASGTKAEERTGERAETGERAGERVEVKLVAQFAPRRSVWRSIDYYVIGGLEWLTPQVLQLGDTTAAMVSGNQSIVIGGGDWGNQEVIRYRIARPLISCLLFILVVMLIACGYFGRSDF